MSRTNQSLLEQLRVTPYGLRQRQILFQLDERDYTQLAAARTYIEPHLQGIVDRFYELQLAIPEVASLIGDAESLARVQRALFRYANELLMGIVDMDYVNTRLRIGLVHKRIGVEPMFYMSAVHSLKTLLSETIYAHVPESLNPRAVDESLKKLLFFDVSLVFDTYIHGLVDEIRTEREKTEEYARGLEEQVRIRTEQLVERSRTDALTGLYNVRHLTETLNRSLHAAERRKESLCFAFIDLDDFKMVNDKYGHRRGDEVLRAVSKALLECVREEDVCFRYGGDEFCAILPRCTEAQAQEILNERLRERLATQDLRLAVRYSVGIVEARPGEFTDPELLVSAADARMYKGKGQHKGQDRGRLRDVDAAASIASRPASERT